MVGSLADPARVAGAHARAHAEERKLYREAVQGALAAAGLRAAMLLGASVRSAAVAQLGLTQEHHLPELATNQTIEQELSLVTLGQPSPAQQAVINAVRQVAANFGMQVLK